VLYWKPELAPEVPVKAPTIDVPEMPYAAVAVPDGALSDVPETPLYQKPTLFPVLEST